MTQQCSVCGNQNLEPCVDYGAIPLCDSYSRDREKALAVPSFEIVVVSCTACRHMELKEKPPEELIYLDYNYFSSNSPDLDAHFAEYARWMKATLGLPADALHIDVGCNDGLLLEKSRGEGFRGEGVDPSPAADRAAAKGFEIHKCFLSADIVAAKRLAAKADVITCNNMMANIRELLAFGRTIFDMLKPGGYLIVETLHFPMLVRNLVFEMINHEHYHYFSVSSIGRFFERLGLQLVSCERTATKGANMRCLARKPLPGALAASPPKIDAALAEAESKLDMAGFIGTLGTARASLASRIASSRQRGPIAGFGAAAPSTIILYLMGLQDQVDFFVDDNPVRHGMFAPGSGIPVISPGEYYARKPALTVLLAWRFGPQIASKHRRNLPADHKFLMANTGAEEIAA